MFLNGRGWVQEVRAPYRRVFGNHCEPDLRHRWGSSGVMSMGGHTGLLAQGEGGPANTGLQGTYMDAHVEGTL